MVRRMLQQRDPVAASEPAAGEASLGFRNVSAESKAGLVRTVFSGVAERYDLMNDLMSAGVHRLWKRALIDRLAPRPGMHLVDIAGGTGDVAHRFLKRCRFDPRSRATVCDANLAMLDAGRERAWNRGVVRAVAWVCGDAEALPLGDRTADACTIAFGIRNVTRIDRALAEVRRILKPGGRFLCLEFQPTVARGLQRAYDAYSFTVIPALGALVAGDRAAYAYLVESIRRFPDSETFSEMIAEAGLERVSARTFSGGVAALHSAWRV